MQETDIPPYPMAKLSLDLSGPYPTTLSGNKYTIAFVPDKTADTVAQLIFEEIYPRHGCALQIVSANETKSVSRTVKETLAKLKIGHVLTNVYHPQSNAKVERFHRTLHDILAKKMADNQQTWDLFLNQDLMSLSHLSFHLSFCCMTGMLFGQ